MSSVAMQTITIRLPDAVLQRARDAASALDRPLEIALAKLVAASFQGVEDAPPEMQSELARMAWLSNHDLRTITRATMPSKQQAQLYKLAAAQETRKLARSEQTQLNLLRREYGQTLLRKAHAFAILSLRSGRALLAS